MRSRRIQQSLAAAATVVTATILSVSATSLFIPAMGPQPRKVNYKVIENDEWEDEQERKKLSKKKHKVRRRDVIRKHKKD